MSTSGAATLMTVISTAYAECRVAPAPIGPATCWVAPTHWHSVHAALHAAGAAYLDMMAAVDRPARGIIEVVTHVMTPDARSRVLVGVEVDRAQPQLPTLTDLYAGAAWHEREAWEMLGVEFAGHDLRRLLTQGESPRWPLRKDTVLVDRQIRDWPGSAESDPSNPSRRRQPPPGVVPGWTPASSSSSAAVQASGEGSNHG